MDFDGFFFINSIFFPLHTHTQMYQSLQMLQAELEAPIYPYGHGMMGGHGSGHMMNSSNGLVQNPVIKKNKRNYLRKRLIFFSGL